LVHGDYPTQDPLIGPSGNPSEVEDGQAQHFLQPSFDDNFRETNAESGGAEA